MSQMTRRILDNVRPVFLFSAVPVGVGFALESKGIGEVHHSIIHPSAKSSQIVTCVTFDWRALIGRPLFLVPDRRIS